MDLPYCGIGRLLILYSLLNSWNYFITHGAQGEQNTDLQANYQEAWLATKQYMATLFGRDVLLNP
jgi:hypothetical protein